MAHVSDVTYEVITMDKAITLSSKDLINSSMSTKLNTSTSSGELLSSKLVC